jgi:hypothetical protein
VDLDRHDVVTGMDDREWEIRQRAADAIASVDETVERLAQRQAAPAERGEWRWPVGRGARMGFPRWTGSGAGAQGRGAADHRGPPAPGG